MGNDRLCFLAIMDKPSNRTAMEGARVVPVQTFPSSGAPVAIYPIDEYKLHGFTLLSTVLDSPREAHTLISMYATEPVALRPLAPSGRGKR